MNEILVLNGRAFPVWFWIVSAISIPVFFWFVIGWIKEFLELSIKLFSHSDTEICQELDRSFELEVEASGRNGSGILTKVVVTFRGTDLGGSLNKEAFATEVETEISKIARSVLIQKVEDQINQTIGTSDKLVLSRIARKYSVQMNEVTCLVTHEHVYSR